MITESKIYNEKGEIDSILTPKLDGITLTIKNPNIEDGEVKFLLTPKHLVSIEEMMDEHWKKWWEKKYENE